MQRTLLRTATRSISLAFAFHLNSKMAASLPAAKSPPFCHDRDCPKFTVAETKDGYEVRKYEPSKWVGTVVSSMSWSSALDIGYKKLYAYREGENKEGTKLEMALPVVTKIVPSQGPACESTFTILFFVPFANQANTPEPTNKDVVIVNLPAVTAYVASFGGVENDELLQSSATKLGDALMRDKVNFVKDYYFTAEYDPPTVKTNRHNEVWFLAT